MRDGDRTEGLGDVVGEFVCCCGFAGEGADLADHVEGRGEIVYIAGPDRIFIAKGFYLVADIFFFGGEDEIGAEVVDDLGVDVFGTADAGFCAEPVIGMDAEFCDAGD